MPRTPIPTYRFALVICQHPTTKDFLMVHEKQDRGWWIPGGGVEQEESFEQAAIRETLEEAGINIRLEGILRVEFSNEDDYARMRVIYFAVPIEEYQTLKTTPDEHSQGAKWLSYKQIKTLQLRGDEPLDWIRYLRKGGVVYPMNVFTREIDEVNL